jgi:hypothetical protein
MYVKQLYKNWFIPTDDYDRAILDNLILIMLYKAVAALDVSQR